jgi:hypothetical protein
MPQTYETGAVALRPNFFKTPCGLSTGEKKNAILYPVLFRSKTGNFYTGNRVGHRSLKVLKHAAGKGFAALKPLSLR